MLGNMFYNVLYQVVTLLAPLIVTPYLSRVLGSAGIGQYALADTYVQYFILAGNIGLITYGSREIAYVRDKKDQLKNTFWELVILRACTIGGAVTVYWLTFFAFDYKHDIVYRIMIISLMASILDISWFYIGIEDFKQRAIKSTFIKVVTVVLVLSCVKNKNQVWLYALISCVGLFISQLILWKGLLKKIPGKPQIKLRAMRKHLKIAVTMFATAIVIQIYTMLDKLMLGEMVGDSSVGYYENAQKIIRALATFMTAAMQAVSPRIANYYFKGEKKSFQTLAAHSFKTVCFFVFPIALGLVGIAGNFSPWFFGSEFAGIDKLLILGSPIIISWGMTGILGNGVLVGTNKQNFLTLAVSIGAIINVILNLCFIGKYGEYAAMSSTVLAEITGLALMLFFVRHDLKIQKLFQGTLRYLIVSLIMCTCVYLIGIIQSGIVGTCIQIVIGIIIYVGILWFIHDQFLIELMAKGKTFLERKKIKDVHYKS